jgi:hypothetical protein
MAQSDDGGTTWSNSLAVDNADTGQIVSMQIAYAGLDSAGNVYVAYPESPEGKQYPDYSGAGVKYKFASPVKQGEEMKWSEARTIVPADPNAPGHLLVHVTIGDPGQLMTVYWTGEPQGGGKEPVWHMTAAETNNGLDAKPTVTEARISDQPTDVGTASRLMGACTQAGPVAGVVNGVVCDRSPDVFGVALDQQCRTSIVWPTVDIQDDPDDPDDDATSAPGSNHGTFVSTQTGGPTLCGSHPGVKTSTGGGCRDRLAPVSRFARKRTRIRRTRLHFQGRSRDRGCTTANGIFSASRIARVYVSIAKVRGKGRGANCAFLTRRGTLTAFRRCRRPVLLRARGTRSWRIDAQARSLPAGSYRVVVRGIDRAKNKERPAKGRNIASFRVR